MDDLKELLMQVRLWIENFSKKLNIVQKVALFFSGFFFLTVVFLSLAFSNNESHLAEELSKQETKAIGGIYIPSLENSDETEAVDAETERLKQSLLSEDAPEDQQAEQTDQEENKSSSTLQKYVYVVKEGDTLSEIASDYNVSVESVAGSSGIRMIDNLKVGQKLQIPSMDGFFYVVNANDRLAKVLDKYNVDINEFLGANQKISLDLVEEGDEVFLPGAKPKNIIRSWLIPVPSRLVTSGYGWRNFPRHSFHKGLDFRAAYVGVRAAKGGTVTYAGSLGGYGYVVIIKHTAGYRSLYGHLSKIYVRRGMKVMQGAVIGRSGNTGYSFGPHLHFEISRYGKTINPATVLTGLHYK